jgi:hypothetical protein
MAFMPVQNVTSLDRDYGLVLTISSRGNIYGSCCFNHCDTEFMYWFWEVGMFLKLHIGYLQNHDPLTKCENVIHWFYEALSDSGQKYNTVFVECFFWVQKEIRVH